MKSLHRLVLALILGLGATVLAAGTIPANAATVTPTVKLSMQYTKLVYGTATDVAAEVDSGSAGVYDGSIQLQARASGATTWKVLRSTAAGTTYGYWTITPGKNTAYRVVYSGYTSTDSSTDSYAAATSPTRTVQVMRNFHAAINSRTLLFHGRIAPAYAHRSVTIQRKTCAACAFKRFKVIRTTASSTWSVKLPAVSKKTYFRAMIPAEGGYVQSLSPVAYTIRY